jgi:hydroxymethylpyrimidine pyrophosphatase-like HAD family hydrolase
MVALGVGEMSGPRFSGRFPGRYKLVAIDMDGTLLSNRGQVTPRTKAAIHRCLSAGILICFATGRNWTES